MPRYFAGRPILVKATVETCVSSASYMKYSDQQNERYVTHKATLIGIDPENDTFVVELEGKTDGPLIVPISETLELNQPHEFSLDVKGDIVLEDSLIFATKGLAEKGKLIEMAFKLEPVVRNMNFNNAVDCFDK